MIIVDRIEGEFAICEQGESIIEIPLSLLPPTLSEGDILIKKGELYFKDCAATAKRRAEIMEKLRKLTDL